MLLNKTFEKKGCVVTCNQINKKIADPRNAKEHYSTKSVKKSKIITQAPKTFENPNIVDSIIIEHPKTSHKLSKTIR